MDPTQQPTPANGRTDSVIAEEADFENYLERELQKLADDKMKQVAARRATVEGDAAVDAAPSGTKTGETSTESRDSLKQPESPIRPESQQPTLVLATAVAFPPKPKPAVLMTVSPSGSLREKKTPTTTTTRETVAAPEAPIPPAMTEEPTTAPTPSPPAPAPPAPAVNAPPRYQYRPPGLKPIETARANNRLRASTLPNRQRPMTASTTTTTTTARRLSYASASTTSTTRRQIKYGTGKHARVELVPQPSDNNDDPLNWPRWKKELNFWSLLTTVALAGVLKTVFVPVHSQLAMGYAVSYTAAAALTGVPLMVSALTGLASLVAARLWGKRPLYLASAVLLFAGSLWNLRAPGTSFAQCMAARVFQGLGWGAFDTLVLGTIHDTYFEHELYFRTAVYDVVVVTTTWGGPLLGGVVSSHGLGFRLQFEILVCFQAAALLLLALGCPETAYDRSFYSLNTPVSAWSNKALPLRPRATLSLEAVRDYVTARGLRPWSYTVQQQQRRASNKFSARIDGALLLQAPRALVAPTTLLLFLVSFLPLCALWSMAASLSLLFAPLPFTLGPPQLGGLLTAPWLLATAAVALLGAAWSRPDGQPAGRHGLAGVWPVHGVVHDGGGRAAALRVYDGQQQRQRQRCG
ncbi:major facilitator superfamily transporter [Niveomyces insectorum RCEF 264]|uniref:Major facilitator superfamily transporter n=1 Tax=Niveomyces insectorum RCEF 264 TaxID=1081102 RepID=A0A167YX86_9HYPO|nr:major facilitator superfamily transporter [Niveomyces insectorum RCEF 264]